MKTRFRQKFLLGLMLFTALFSLVPTSVFAADQTGYLTPASGSTQTSNTFTVSVDGYVTNTWWFWIEEGATSVQGTLNYPTSQLKVVSIDTSGSAFPTGTYSDAPTTGSITINGTSSGSYLNQTVHLFNVTFQAVGAGTAGVSFGSLTYSTGAAVTTGGSYTITSPPAPTPTPKPTPKPSTSPKLTTKATPTATPEVVTPEVTPAPISESDGGLEIENVEVTATRTENSVAFSLNNPAATPTVSYGTSKDNLQDAGTIPQQSDGSYKLTMSDLRLGTLYYFTVKASTADNLQGATYSGVLTTRGYPVQLTIEQNHLLIPGAEVKIGQRQFVANNNGIITAELSDGKYTASITPPNSSQSYNESFTVKKLNVPSDGGNPDLQSFVLNITTVVKASSSSSTILPTIIGGAIAIVTAIGVFIGFALFRRKNKADTSLAGQSTDVDTGQLRQIYGGNVEQYMNNTPEANLGGNFGPAPTAIAAETQATLQAEIQPIQAPSGETVNLAAQPSPTDTPLDLSTQQITGVQFDPATLPLPPLATAPPQDLAMQPDAAVTPVAAQEVQPVDSYADQPVQQTSPEEAEALSVELSKVESSEQISDSNEPSAVYDASTGELDIIHHHAEAGPAAPVAEPAQAPVIAPEPELQVAPASALQQVATPVQQTAPQVPTQIHQGAV